MYKFINIPEELKTIIIGTTTKLAKEEISKRLKSIATNSKDKQKQEDLPKINTLEHIEEVENNFQEMFEINKIKFSRKSYPKT